MYLSEVRISLYRNLYLASSVQGEQNIGVASQDDIEDNTKEGDIDDSKAPGQSKLAKLVAEIRMGPNKQVQTQNTSSAKSYSKNHVNGLQISIKMKTISRCMF